MSNNVASIKDSIKARLSSVLGTEWSELNYSRNVQKNSSKGIANKFGVNPKAVQEVDSQTRFITLEHEFEVILSQQFINTPMSEANEQAAVTSLMDKGFDCYKDFISTRLSNSSVVNIYEYASEEPETDEESKSLTMRFTFKVRYRTNF